MNCSNLGLSEYWTVYSLKFCSRPCFIMPFSTFIYIPVPLLEKTDTLVFINLFSVWLLFSNLFCFWLLLSASLFIHLSLLHPGNLGRNISVKSRRILLFDWVSLVSVSWCSVKHERIKPLDSTVNECTIIVLIFLRFLLYFHNIKIEIPYLCLLFCCLIMFFIFPIFRIYYRIQVL